MKYLRSGDYMMWNSLAQYSNPVGIVGVILTLLAFYLININKISSMSLTYLGLNLTGAILLLFSLMFHWNLSSVVIEIAWISISLLGIYRYINKTHEKKMKKASLYGIGDLKSRHNH